MSTTIYLIRHGIAADREDYNDDSIRPLTDKGIGKTKQVAQRLQDIGIQFNLILTSPLVRAKQTAQILQKTGLSSEIQELAALEPGGNLETWVTWWHQSSYNSDRSVLALVGHQPDLGNWAEILTWGHPTDRLILKKAGIIGLELPETGTPVANSDLFLLTSPKWLL